MLEIEVWLVIIQATYTDEVFVVWVREHESFPRSRGC